MEQLTTSTVVLRLTLTQHQVKHQNQQMLKNTGTSVQISIFKAIYITVFMLAAVQTVVFLTKITISY